jgi:hypothetical protein
MTEQWRDVVGYDALSGLRSRASPQYQNQQDPAARQNQERATLRQPPHCLNLVKQPQCQNRQT